MLECDCYLLHYFGLMQLPVELATAHVPRRQQRQLFVQQLGTFSDAQQG